LLTKYTQFLPIASWETKYTQFLPIASGGQVSGAGPAVGLQM